MTKAPMTKRRTLLIATALAVVCALAASLLTSSSSAGQQAKPSVKGKVLWYADVLKGNPILDAIAQGLNNGWAAAGGKMVRSYATNAQGQVDLAAQAQSIDRAIAKKPAAIAFFLLDPKALRPQIQRARRAGIPVFSMFGQPASEVPVNGWISVQTANMGRAMAQAIVQRVTKGDEVSMIAPPLPIPVGEIALDAAIATFNRNGLKVVGDRNQQRNSTDLAEGGRQVMQGILQRFPNLKAMYVYNDDSAIGAVAAIRAAGKSGDIVVVSRNGSSPAIAGVKRGDLAATCDIGSIEIGQGLAKAIIRHLTTNKKYNRGAQLPTPTKFRNGTANGKKGNCIIDRSNVGRYVPPEKRIKYKKIKEG